MKKMKKGILLILLLLFSILLFDRLFTYLIFEHHHHFFSKGNFQRELKEHLKNNEYNALIMGSSRTYEGIYPPLIRTEKLKPFKWSFAGFGPRYNYYFYNLYKNLAGTPDTVIFGIDYFIYTLFSSPEELAQLVPDETEGTDINYCKPELLLLKNKPKVDIVVKDILQALFPPINNSSRDISKIQAYRGTGKGELKNKKIHTEKDKRYSGVAFTPPPGNEGEYFYRMLDTMRKDGVNVILVVIPEYIGTYRTNRFKRAFRKHLSKLKITYPNVSVLNFNYARRFALSDENLFLDGGYGFTNSHLSKEGAEVFNRMLLSALEQLGY